MKKIIAILAMVALVGGVAFAEAAVSGHVIGTVNLFESDTSKATDNKISGSGGFNRVRLEASGSDEEGKFGAWLRVGDDIDAAIVAGLAWWKPIDQFKLTVGGNPDGIFGKEGNTGWMFYQTVSDTGVAMGGENVWGWALTNGFYNYWDGGVGGFGAGVKTRDVFYEGFGGNGLLLEIKPIEMFGLNIVLPYFTDGALVEDIFKDLTLQLDLNLDFGNIALTFKGDASGASGGNVYVYAGIGAIENVALDIGLSLILDGDTVKKQPLGVGLGAKVDISETFGLKARLAALVPTDSDDKTTRILFDVLPFFALSDSMTVFVSVGLGLVDFDGEACVGFHFNPYLQVGSEWGPKFLAGIKVWQMAAYEGKFINDFVTDSHINWAVPIAVNVSF